MAAAGIEDIVVAYPVVGRDKIERLLNLSRWVPRISTSIDTIEAARALNDAAVSQGACIDVLVEVDAGYGRTGIEPDDVLLSFATDIVASMPGLRYKGLMYMASETCKHVERERQLAGEQAGAKVATDAAALLQANGIETQVISGGSTPGAQYLHYLQGVNEYRAGCYVFGDMKYADLGAHTREQMSLTILSAVVSVPSVSEPNRFVVDAGSKTLTHSGAFTTPGYGTFVEYPDLSVNVASEEHGTVHLPSGFGPPAIGTKLDIYPNYVSDVVNLADELWVVQDDDVIGVWDILARGKRV
jgi:D-serine deaminase-like pyridoxal phosphate-dependent protein